VEEGRKESDKSALGEKLHRKAWSFKGKKNMREKKKEGEVVKMGDAGETE